MRIKMQWERHRRGLYSGDKVIPVEEGEARVLVVTAGPYSQTKAEIREHYPLHLQYRSWCPDCVRGKGHSRHHRAWTSEPSDGATWHMDYCFFSKDMIEEVEEGHAGGCLPVLVKCDEAKNVMGIADTEGRNCRGDEMELRCN